MRRHWAEFWDKKLNIEMMDSRVADPFNSSLNLNPLDDEMCDSSGACSEPAW